MDNQDDFEFFCKKRIINILDNLEKSIGTGFFINQDTIVTCLHVIKNHYSKEDVIKYKFFDSSKIYSALCRNKSALKQDICVLVSGERFGFETINDFITETPEKGEELYSFGFPEGSETGINVKVTYGDIILKEKYYYFQLFNANGISHGLSGAPIWNGNNTIIGVISKITNTSYGRLNDLAFAIPMKDILEVANEEKDKKRQKKYWRNTLLELQKKQILNASAMPWMTSESVSYEFIIPSLIVNTVLTLKKHGLKECAFNYFIQQKQTGNVIVTGEAGVGKSTLLSCMFLKMIERSTEELCFFIDARNFYEYNNEDFLEFLLKELGVNKNISYYFENEYIYVFIDGLDEVDKNTLSNIMQVIYRNRLKIRFIVACRDYVFANHIACHKQWSGMFQEVVNVEKWNVELSNNYVNDYLRAIGKEEYIELIINSVAGDNSFEEIYSNPFQLNILIYLFIQNIKEIKNRNIANLYLLYERFVHTLFKNELIRDTTECKYDDFIKKMITIAKYIFADQTDGLKKHLGYYFKEIFGNNDNLQNDSIYAILLIIDRSGQIIKFRHETLYEFFIARSFIMVLQMKSVDLLMGEFKNFYDFYINKFIRSGLEACRKHSKEFYQSLCSVYFSCIKKDIHLNKNFKKIVKDYSPKYMKNCKALSVGFKKNIYIRELAVYYAGRLVFDSAPKLLTFAYNYDPNDLIRRTAVLGLILNNDEEAEKKYLDSLIPGTTQDIMQRSLTLIYFGDDVGDIYSYKDKNSTSWEKSKCAIIDRLKIDNKRNYLYRYWDLKTIYLFCYSRNSCDLISDEDFEIIKNASVDSNLYSDLKKRRISDEKRKLIQYIEKERL